MGLVMGLGEGTARIVLRHFHLVTAAEDGSTAPQFIWISALSGSALLATAALGFAALESVLPRKWWSRVAIALFAFFLFFDWVGISGWIPENAAAMLALGYRRDICKVVLQPRDGSNAVLAPQLTPGACFGRR